MKDITRDYIDYVSDKVLFNHEEASKVFFAEQSIHGWDEMPKTKAILDDILGDAELEELHEKLMCCYESEGREPQDTIFTDPNIQIQDIPDLIKLYKEYLQDEMGSSED